MYIHIYIYMYICIYIKPFSNPNDILKSAKNFYTKEADVQNCHC